MPLKKATNNTKKSVNEAVSANMHELNSSAAKPRPQKQKVAIAIAAAKRK